MPTSRVWARAVFGVSILTAFTLGVATGAYITYERTQELRYMQMVNFCHDRMKNGVVRYVWRQEYCGKNKEN